MKKILIFITTCLFAMTNYQYQKKLGIGIDCDWALYPKEIKNYNSKIPKDFKAKGFNTIRLRIDFYLPKKINGIKKVRKRKISDKKYLKIIKKVVKDCLKNSLNVVLSYNALNFKQTPNKITENELLNHWKIIAKTFKNYPYTISYDLIIEPAKKLNKRNELLNDFYKKAYKMIRTIDSKRIIMWAPDKRSNPFLLPKTWYPKNDNHIMAEWHMYAAGPKNDYKKIIPEKVNFAYRWSVLHHIPVWIGAWMPGNYNHGDNISIQKQIEFSKFMIAKLKKYNIPFAINADRKFYNFYDKNFEYRTKVLNTIMKIYKNN